MDGGRLGQAGGLGEEFGWLHGIVYDPVKDLDDGDGAVKVSVKSVCSLDMWRAVELDYGESGMLDGLGDTLGGPIGEDAYFLQAGREFGDDLGDLRHRDLSGTGSEDEADGVRA